MNAQIIRYAPFFVYAFLACLILAPLFAPGFILTIDMVFVPHPPMPQELTNEFIFRAVLHWCSFLVPAEILQKLILFLALFLAGLGAHKLCAYLIKSGQTAQWAAYAAGVFYIFNPFVYGRLMAGQYLILLGLALLPFFARVVLQLTDHPNRRSAIIAAAWGTLVALISLHMLGIALILALVILGVKSGEKKERMGKILQYSALGTGLFLVLNSYWLISLLMGHSTLTDAISQFSLLDFQAFASDGGLFAILQLKGFWLEAQGVFMSAGEPLPLTGLWQIILWAIILTGAIAAWKRQRFMALIGTCLAIIALCFAIDSPLSQLLVALAPGYREPHKFVVLLVIAFAIFIAYGVNVILEKTQKARPIAAAGFMLLPILITPALLWGGFGQLQPTRYPKSWYELNELLKPRDRVVLLPWHMYMQFSFTNRIIANPADAFFDTHIISSQNPEFAGSRSPHHNTETNTAEKILFASPRKELASQLRVAGITHVLLVKEGDWRDYDFAELGNSLVKETAEYKLYAVKKGGE